MIFIKNKQYNKFFVSISLIFYSINSLINCKTVFVFDIHRHGARKALLEDKHGNLSNYGRIQQYLIGSELRQRYIYQQKLLSENFNSSEIYILSSPKERAIESINWQLSGLYPSNNQYNNVKKIKMIDTKEELPPIILSDETQKQQIKENKIISLSSPAIKFITQSEKGVNGHDMFFHGYKECLKSIQIVDNKFSTQEYQLFQNNNKQTWIEAVNIILKKFDKNSEVAKKYDINNPDLKHLGQILDYYICNSYHGVALPEFSQDLIQRLKQIKTDLLLKYFFGSEFTQKVSVTLMFKQMRDILQYKFGQQQDRNAKKLSNQDMQQLYDQLKFVIYSCHDRNIFLFLLNILTKEQFKDYAQEMIFQPFSSLLLVEVIVDEEKNQYYIQLNYNDKIIYLDQCQDKQSKLKSLCTVQQFIQILDSRIISNLDKECQES